MFTGIIESLSSVIELVPYGEQNRRLYLQVEKNINPKFGDSIAVNGCCLTAVEHEKKSSETHNTLAFDVSEETLNCTNLGQLESSKQVNIERAMLATSRFDGHMVSGHVDCCGILVEKKMNEDFCLISFEIKEKSLFKQFIKKGSICINGVSLTINEVIKSNSSIQVGITLIPETLKRTNLGQLKTGSKVNIESDVIAKYLESMMINYNK